MISRKTVSYLFCFVLLMFFIVACGTLGSKTTQSSGKDTPERILFIGNHYIYINFLPDMFAELARSGGHKVEVGMSACPNCSLRMHTSSPDTLKKLDQQDWDFVVLIENNNILATLRNEDMYPAIRLLKDMIRERGATVILFMPWGHRDGLPTAGYKDYPAYQAGIQAAYMEIADELDLMVAPVGIAWRSVVTQDQQMDLWGGDRDVPSETGTYLAACVFYAVIFRQSPEGLKYTAELSEEKARFLQAVAAETVLEEPGRWNLP
jgi:hypothetical protein